MDIDTSSEVEWCQWERVEQMTTSKKEKTKKRSKTMKKICKLGTVDKAFQSLEDQMPYFLQHVYVKRQQSAFFDGKKANLTQSEALVQVDFAENYTCKHQDEVQSAHWHQQQITLFTVAVWTNNGSETTCKSHVIVTDELSHEKKSVAVMMSHIIDQIVKNKAIKKVHVFSDGPTSQFKNKYIAHFLHQLRAFVSIEWHYFATSHGKGVVDGIGGTVKRMVWNAVSTRKVHAVKDAKTFAEVAKSACNTINVVYLPKDQIDARARFLCLKNCFTSAPVLKGISKFHSLQPLENGLIRCRTYSIQSTWEDKGLKEQSDTDSEESLSDLSEDIQSEDEKDLEDEESDFNEMHLLYTLSDDGRTTTDQGERNNAQGSDTDEMPDDVDVSKPSEMPKSIPPMSEKNNINIEVGLPDGILPLFNGSIKFQLPHHLECYVSAILDGSIKFQGASLISNEDLKALHGVPLPKNPKENWLSNFVIDEYLCLLKSESAKNGTLILLKHCHGRRLRKALALFPPKE